jgi:hypothetical protein
VTHLICDRDLLPDGHSVKSFTASLGITYRMMAPSQHEVFIVLFGCEGVPEHLPSCLRVYKHDPRTLIGFWLSEDKVREIESWEANP